MRPTPNLPPAEASNEGLPPLQGWRRTFAALRNRNYRYFYIGQSLSLIGTWTRTAALGWLAFQVTRSEFLLGVVFMLNSLPIFLFAVFTGALADRMPKLRIFTFTSWFALLSSLTLALMLFHGPVSIDALMVFSVLWGTATAFEMPARQTLMVELVGRRDLVNAIALNSAMVNSTRVIGPAIGGILLATVGASWCFLLDALSFVAVLIGLYKIRLPASHYAPRTARHEPGYFLEGFRYLRANPLLARSVALLAVLGLGGWAYRSQLPAFASAQLHMGADGYGWLLAMNGLGACIAALVVAGQGARLLSIRTLYVGAALYSLFIILFGFERNPAGAAFLLFCAGFGIILFFSVGNSLIQTHSPDHLRGRLMGIWALVFGGGMPLGSLWMGWVAGRTSSGFSMQAGGLFCALGSLAVYAFFRGSRKGKKA